MSFIKEQQEIVQRLLVKEIESGETWSINDASYLIASQVVQNTGAKFEKGIEDTLKKAVEDGACGSYKEGIRKCLTDVQSLLKDLTTGV